MDNIHWIFSKYSLDIFKVFIGYIQSIHWIYMYKVFILTILFCCQVENFCLFLKRVEVELNLSMFKNVLEFKQIPDFVAICCPPSTGQFQSSGRLRSKSQYGRQVVQNITNRQLSLEKTLQTDNCHQKKHYKQTTLVRKNITNRQL